MRNSLVATAILLLCAQASPQTLPSDQVATKNSGDVHAALCDIDNRDYTAAEKKLVNGQPRKVYAYARVSCAERKESVLIVQAGRTHYYTIDITGANESDARVQRFLKSVKLK